MEAAHEFLLGGSELVHLLDGIPITFREFRHARDAGFTLQDFRNLIKKQKWADRKTSK